MNRKNRPTIDRLMEVFDYCPETGALHRKFKTKTKKVGYLDEKGYLQVTLDNWQGRAHQIAFAMHYGEWANDVIDHINGDGSDNRIQNLRSATSRENSANRQRAGVSLHRGRYRASIMVDGNALSLGVFPNPDHAENAIAFADIMFNGKFAHTDSKEKVSQIHKASLI